MSTLDLLDECLTAIHRCRKSTLMARAKRFDRRMEKRRGKLKSQSRMRTSTTKLEQEDDNDDDGNDNLDDEMFSVTFGSAPPQKKKPQIVIKSKPSPPPIKAAFETIESQKGDLKAAEIFANFRDELTAWWEKSTLTRQDVDVRGEYADYLTDKYMCQQLDPCPPSRVVTNIRKQLSHIIEEFAQGSDLPINFPEVAFSVQSQAQSEQAQLHTQAQIPDESVMLSSSFVASQGAPKPTAGTNISGGSHSVSKPTGKSLSVINQAKALVGMGMGGGAKVKPKEGGREGSPSQDNGRASVSTGSSSSPAAPSGPVSAADKKKIEKDKIKAQYEAFVKNRKAAETHPDNKQVQDIEALNDDIRSLLSTLGNKPK